MPVAPFDQQSRAGTQVNALVHQLPQHKEKIKEKVAALRGSGEGAFGKFLQMIWNYFLKIGEVENQLFYIFLLKMIMTILMKIY